jgi:hypothetical protein
LRLVESRHFRLTSIELFDGALNVPHRLCHHFTLTVIGNLFSLTVTA